MSNKNQEPKNSEEKEATGKKEEPGKKDTEKEKEKEKKEEPGKKDTGKKEEPGKKDTGKKEEKEDKVMKDLVKQGKFVPGNIDKTKKTEVDEPIKKEEIANALLQIYGDKITDTEIGMFLENDAYNYIRLPKSERNQFLRYCEGEDEYEDDKDIKPEELDKNIMNTKFGEMGYYFEPGEMVELRSGKEQKFYDIDDPDSKNIRGLKKPQEKLKLVLAPYINSKRRRTCISRKIKNKKSFKQSMKNSVNKAKNMADATVKATQNIAKTVGNNPFSGNKDETKSGEKEEKQEEKEQQVEKPKVEISELEEDLNKIKEKCNEHFKGKNKFLECESKCTSDNKLGFCIGNLKFEDDLFTIDGDTCYENTEEGIFKLLEYLDKIYFKNFNSVNKYEDCFYDNQCKKDMKCVNIPEECNLNKNRKICL